MYIRVRTYFLYVFVRMSCLLYVCTRVYSMAESTGAEINSSNPFTRAIRRDCRTWPINESASRCRVERADAHGSKCARARARTTNDACHALRLTVIHTLTRAHERRATRKSTPSSDREKERKKETACVCMYVWIRVCFERSVRKSEIRKTPTTRYNRSFHAKRQPKIFYSI